jgi:rhamnosyltransferase subunit B
MGDLNPYICVGTELARRGHEVTLLTDALKQDAVRKAGLGFAEVLSRSAIEHAISQQALWEPATCLETLVKLVYLPAVLPVFRHVLSHYQPRNTVLIGVPGAMGLNLARERLGAPLVHLYLSPHQAMRRAHASDEEQHELRSLLNQLRRMVRLHPIEGAIQNWTTTADMRIGAFPSWFGAAVSTGDLTVTNFLFSDDSAPVGTNSTALEKFLASGSAPIVFTGGTGTHHLRDFFSSALAACEQLAARAVFLTTSADDVPQSLPCTVLHETYAPLRPLLRHAAGLVHHGGVGTCAQALRAGIFQLVMPMAFDQFDNAQRIESLGVGRTFARGRIGGARLAASIGNLRRSVLVRQRCRDVSQRLAGVDARTAIADLVETAGGTYRALECMP